jgi:hypothetical protein
MKPVSPDATIVQIREKHGRPKPVNAAASSVNGLY